MIVSVVSTVPNFLKIAQIACELFVADEAIRAIGATIWKPGLGAVKLQSFLHRAGLPHGIKESQLKILRKIKPSSTFLEGFYHLFRNEND